MNEETRSERIEMKEKIIGVLIGIILVLLIGFGTYLYQERGKERVAIVTDKYEVGGAHFVKVVIPVDTDTYIGLDVGDECTFEE